MSAGAGDGDTPLPPPSHLGSDTDEASSSPPSRYREPIALFLLLMFAGALHSRSLWIGYMADDYDLIYALNRPNYSLLAPLPFGRGSYFRPTVMLSLMLELRAGGGPMLHHAVNLAIHLVNGVVLFLILRRLRVIPPLAFSFVFLFLCHRSSVPNVYWISPRAETLACMGYLMAILGILGCSNRRCAFSMILLTICGVLLAFLSKESAVSLPLALLLLWWFTRSDDPLAGSVEQRSGLALITSSAALCLMYLVYLAGRFYVRQGGVPTATIGEIAAGVTRGVVLLLVPITESGLQSISRNVTSVASVIGFAALAGLIALLARRNLRGVVLTAGLPLVSFLPILVIQGGGGARVLYLPIALACIGIGAANRTAGRHLAFGAGALGALMAVASFTTGSDWVRNWALSKACCRDFRRISGVYPDAPVVLLTTPRQRGDAPVLSNDARAFLYYCRNRRPGYLQNLESVAEVVLVQSTAAYPVVRQKAADSAAIAYRIKPGDGWFIFPAARVLPLKTGDTISLAAGQIRLRQSSPGEGLVTDFEIVLNSSETPPERIIVEFTGTGFRRIPSD